MTTVAFTLNGVPISADVQPRTHLGDFLRDGHRLSGTHLGCEHGVCGACTVQINGAQARSCLTLAVACDGAEVMTIEGFDHDPVMADLREAFTTHHGLQCGFCTPGMLIAARDIVLRVPDAAEKTIRRELSGNLCRCTGYVGIVDAIASVIEKRKERTEAALATPARTAAAFATFEPIAPSSTASRSPSSRETLTFAREASLRPGWTRFDESFVIHKPRAVIWELFGDVRRVAACLPGVEVTSCDDTSAKGRMMTKLGPIAASFAGSALITRDPANWSGTIVGAGTDSGSGSRTKGEIVYRLGPIEQDEMTRVDLSVLYNLQGSLAQFSRSGLAQEFARQLVAKFAENCSSQLGGGQPAAPASQSLDVGKMLWLASLAWLKQIFRRSN
ncbi:2Fe-2S iron-sulfur cluster-binding protein [Bradyrhizobium sp. URHD0069]|uniref:xanthine dehydrogenase family Fe-S subunit n=1 Tax=Bradyrhizobium sp. URHD0069 TaxID=1380355 RepID=UPI000495F7A4|nr:2Fe-2S iron-sulfur cluster-binding protein [Bradyrhizobium sp. URHD0069]